MATSKGPGQQFERIAGCVTAHRDAPTIQAMFEAGADDYVNKPIISAELLTRLANCVERAQLYRRLAETDGLTGASMRRQSVRVLGRYIRLARRQSRPFSVAILDVDHFKSVNDRFGHNVGDRVLSRVGGLLVDTFRVEDVVARWGGEEFLVGMYGTARDDAATRVRAILSEVRDIVFQDDAGGEFSITISGGVAELSDASATLDDLIRIADDALYAAKEGGRDRVIVAGATRKRPTKPVRRASALTSRRINPSPSGKRIPPMPRPPAT